MSVNKPTATSVLRRFVADFTSHNEFVGLIRVAPNINRKLDKKDKTAVK